MPNIVFLRTAIYFMAFWYVITILIIFMILLILSNFLIMTQSLLSSRWVGKSGEAWMIAGISDGTRERVTSNDETNCFRKKGGGYT